MIEFFNYYIHPESKTRAKLAVHLVAQATSDVTTKQISDLVKNIGLNEEAATQATTDLKARLGASNDDEAKEEESVKEYLTNTLSVAADKIEAAVDTWKQLSKYHKAISATDKAEDKANSGLKKDPNGTMPVKIESIREFRISVSLTGGPRAITDISEFLDVDAKL